MKVIVKTPLWILQLIIVTSNLTEMMFSNSLTSMASYFNLKAGDMQTSVTVYLVGFAIGVVVFGRLSDLLGRRPSVIIGITIYFLASALSIIVQDFWAILVLRFMQAVGASTSSVVGQAIVRDSYKDREISNIYATLAIGIALVPAIGSVISGYIIEYYNWRYIFVFLSIFSGISLLIYVFFLAETNPNLGVCSNYSYKHVIKVALRDKVLLLNAFIVAYFNSMVFCLMMEAPFMLIRRVGVEPSSYGRIYPFIQLAAIIGSLYSRNILQKHVKMKKIIILGLACSSVSAIIILIGSTIFKYYEHILTIKIFAVPLVIFPMALHMVGMNFAIPIVMRYALKDYTKVTGTAGSIFGAIYYCMIALINFVATRIHDDNLGNFAILFSLLTVSCNIAFYLIQKLQYNTDSKIKTIAI